MNGVNYLVLRIMHFWEIGKPRIISEELRIKFSKIIESFYKSRHKEERINSKSTITSSHILHYWNKMTVELFHCPALVKISNEEKNKGSPPFSNLILRIAKKNFVHLTNYPWGRRFNRYSWKWIANDTSRTSAMYPPLLCE